MPIHQVTSDRGTPGDTNAPFTIPGLLVQAADLYHDRPFIVTPTRTLSYAQTLQASRQLTHLLREAGVKSGDRVAVLHSNDWQFVTAILAVIMTRAIAVPLDPRVRPAAFSQIGDDCGLRALICEHSAVERLKPALDESKGPSLLFLTGCPSTVHTLFDRPVCSLDAILVTNERVASSPDEQIDPNSVVSISYTSGSTGTPKGVMHSHRSWLSSAAFTVKHLGLRAGDSMLIPLPLHHGYAFRHVLAYMLSGGTVILTNGLLDGLERLEDDRPDALLLVPDTCSILLKNFKELLGKCSSFAKLISVGTAAMPQDLLQQLRELLPNAAVHLPYGLTEARVGFLRLEDEPSRRRLFAVAPGLEVSVVDGNGRAVETGHTGEIVIRGEGLMVGYYGSGDEDLRHLREFGFRTGDMGRVAETGEIALVGRIDDVIKVGGRKVLPLEVESILNRHQAVSESAVMAAPDPAGIADVRLEAVVVLKKNATIPEADLIKHCKEHLEAYKVPSAFMFAPALRKTAVGKIIRRHEDASLDQH